MYNISIVKRTLICFASTAMCFWAIVWEKNEFTLDFPTLVKGGYKWRADEVKREGAETLIGALSLYFQPLYAGLSKTLNQHYTRGVRLIKGGLQPPSPRPACAPDAMITITFSSWPWFGLKFVLWTSFLLIIFRHKYIFFEKFLFVVFIFEKRTKNS